MPRLPLMSMRALRRAHYDAARLRYRAATKIDIAATLRVVYARALNHISTPPSHLHTRPSLFTPSPGVVRSGGKAEHASGGGALQAKCA